MEIGSSVPRSSPLLWEPNSAILQPNHKTCEWQLNNPIDKKTNKAACETNEGLQVPTKLPTRKLKLKEVIITMNEGDATTTKEYESAPHESDIESLRSCKFRETEQNYCREGQSMMMTHGDPAVVQPVPKQCRSKITVESYEVKKSSIKTHSITEIESKTSIFGTPRVRVGPTTRSLPRQAKASVYHDKRIIIEHSKLGGPPRISPRQVINCPELAHEKRLKSVPTSEDRHRSPFQPKSGR